MVSVKGDIYFLATNITTCVQNCVSQINKVRRITRSRLAVETLFVFDCSDTAYFINQLAQEVDLVRPPPPVLTYMDSRLVHDTEETTTKTVECRLCIEVSAVRELQDNRKISICWQNKVK